ncbi:MAG: hypothetical protein JWL96_4565 [Sphingomonas bacterium]|nr:hypothetical protein [Sphingomonas bacterium]
MSGNSTRFAVGAVETRTTAVVATGLIAGFLLGVVLGSLCGSLAGRHRRSAVLGLVAMFLSGAALLGSAGERSVAIGLVALAMGAVNATFEQRDGGSVGLTYMTGALARIGQGVAAALLGRGGREWLSYVALWGGLIGGAMVGTIVYRHIAMAALWVPAGVTLCLAFAAHLMRAR